MNRLLSAHPKSSTQGASSNERSAWAVPRSCPKTPSPEGRLYENERDASNTQGDELGAPSHEKEVVTVESNHLSRRSFFGRFGASTALAATSAALPSLLLGKTANADDGDGGADDPASRRDRSYRLRKKVALAERDIPTPPHISNGDETLYPNFIGSYSQGLPHNSLGEVVPAAYQALLTACDTGKPSDFANIPLGGTSKFVDPQGGLAYDLEGTRLRPTDRSACA